MLTWILVGLTLFASPVPTSADTTAPPSVRLNGEWSFRAGDDLRWADPSLELRQGEWRLIPVPGDWEQLLPGYDGWGWYRREVALDSALAQGPLGLRLGTVGDAFEVYWNGVLIGKRGAFPPRFVEGVHPSLLIVPPGALALRPRGPHVLAVRVYNDYAFGGMMGGAKLGRYDVLVAESPPRETVIGGLISFFLAVGVYHLVFFFRRRSARENLYFAVLCALVALYGATYSGVFAARVIPYINPYRLGLLASLAASPVFILLTSRLFELRIGRWSRGAGAVFLAGIPVAALLPLDLLARFNDLFSAAVFLGLIAIVARGAMAGSRYTPHAHTLAAGTAAFAVCVIWDLGNEYDVTPVARVLPGVPGLFWLGFLGFVMAVGIVTAGKWALTEVHALTDPLTGLARRHVFEEALRREAGRLRRSGGTMSVVVIDIDHFKQINDTHGHRMGDEVLARVGRLLRHNARNIDLPARMGGEEFGVLLPDTGVEGAEALVRRFREHLCELDLPLAASGGTVRVTASAGVATGSDLVDPDAILDAADRALYRAKREGRDRTVVVGLGEAERNYGSG